MTPTIKLLSHPYLDIWIAGLLNYHTKLCLTKPPKSNSSVCISCILPFNQVCDPHNSHSITFHFLKIPTRLFSSKIAHALISLWRTYKIPLSTPLLLLSSALFLLPFTAKEVYISDLQLFSSHLLNQLTLCTIPLQQHVKVTWVHHFNKLYCQFSAFIDHKGSPFKGLPLIDLENTLRHCFSFSHAHPLLSYLEMKTKYTEIRIPWLSSMKFCLLYLHSLTSEFHPGKGAGPRERMHVCVCTRVCSHMRGPRHAWEPSYPSVCTGSGLSQAPRIKPLSTF